MEGLIHPRDSKEASERVVGVGRPAMDERRNAPVEFLPTDKKGPDHGIGLCLSGGGYQAVLFHLGSLWRLAELGFLPLERDAES